MTYFRAISEQAIVKHKPDLLEITTIDSRQRTKKFSTIIKISQSKIKRRKNTYTILKAAFMDETPQSTVHTTRPPGTEALAIRPAEDGFLMKVETKGGATAGRQKQRYLLLQRGETYVIEHVKNRTVIAMDLRAHNSHSAQPLKFSTYAPGTTPPPESDDEGEEEQAPHIHSEDKFAPHTPSDVPRSPPSLDPLRSPAPPPASSVLSSPAETSSQEFGSAEDFKQWAPEIALPVAIVAPRPSAIALPVAIAPRPSSSYLPVSPTTCSSSLLKRARSVDHHALFTNLNSLGGGSFAKRARPTENESFSHCNSELSTQLQPIMIPLPSPTAPAWSSSLSSSFNMADLPPLEDESDLSDDFLDSPRFQAELKESKMVLPAEQIVRSSSSAFYASLAESQPQPLLANSQVRSTSQIAPIEAPLSIPNLPSITSHGDFLSFCRDLMVSSET